MEYSLMRRKNGGLMVCVLLALVTRLTVMAANEGKRLCYDWKGNKVEHGAQFIPNIQDPCMKCTCDDSYPIMCQAVSCHPPDNNCIEWIKIESECCVYKCRDPPGLNPDLPGQENSTIGDGSAVEDDSITNLGLRLVASTVTSFLVLALLLFMVHRLRQRRLLLAMRRFEARARQQQLEESESDPYIPDTYLGMIECPPYEDPPPPYSSPKPHPRILPGEAPPPYEEVDQNRNTSNNNNNNNVNMVTSGTQGNVTDNQSHQETHQNGQPVESQERSFSRGLSGHGGGGGGGDSQPCHRRVGSEASPQASMKNHESNPAPQHGGAVAEADRANSPGRVSTSTDSTESHNCSCDSEQTLLKQALASERSCDGGRSSQSLPLGFCLGQERSKGRRSKHHSSSPKTSRNNQGHLNPGADLAWSPGNGSRAASQDAGHCSQKHPQPSSHRHLQCEGEGQRADSSGVVTSGNPCLSADNEVLHHPLTEEMPGVSSSNPDRRDMSQSCVVLRERKLDGSDQEQLRKSLPPLDLSVGNGASAQPVDLDTSGNQYRSSNEYLRNVRLSNLLNSPTPAFETGGSPVSPLARHMQRSHSMTSDISSFSVCSETGEKRATKVAADKMLRNDSQYPDIPVSAHAMRMAAITRQFDGQGHPQCDGQGQYQGQCQGQASQPAGDGSNGDARPSSVIQDVGADFRRLQPDVECLETSENPAPSSSRLELQAAATASDANTKYNLSPRSHQSKKKDKHKPNRHSTGSILQNKPKKRSSHSSPNAGHHLPPSPTCGGRTAEASAQFSPSHLKKSTGDKHGSPGNKTSSPRAGAGKGDNSKKKVVKPICDSYKQYGFIDDPSFLQSRNGVVELKLVDSENVEKLGSIQCEKTALNCETKANIPAKLGSKRHLTSADKSVYSPSPTRQKSSRPRSYVNPSCQGEGSLSQGHDGSNSPSAIAYRKSRNPGKSKKRVSYPVVGPDASHNASVQSGTQRDASVTENSNAEVGQVSHPLGFITVSNGPLSSYV